MTESELEYITKLEKELKDLREQNASQLSMYEMTTLYLKKLQEDLKISEQNLLRTNKNLVDSINYAKHIQDAFILQISVLQKTFPNSFIFQQPKDIVSGDFIWMFEYKHYIYLGVGDCTGHGVPGAMLSIFMISMLNQIVSLSQNQTPAEILRELDELIKKYLLQYDKNIKDSAEISLIKYNKKTQTILFSAANRPLVHIRNNNITIYKGAKCVLGNDERRNEVVKDIEVVLNQDDMIYMFSDGYADQFGGEKNSKFSTKKLYNLLQDCSNLPVNEQQEKLQSTYTNWKGEKSQIDDVVLVGIKF